MPATVSTHLRVAPIGVKLLLCKHQPQVSDVVLTYVLHLRGVQVWVITLKVLSVGGGHK